MIKKMIDGVFETGGLLGRCFVACAALKVMGDIAWRGSVVMQNMVFAMIAVAVLLWAIDPVYKQMDIVLRRSSHGPFTK